jgi:hypothetical protein
LFPQKQESNRIQMSQSQLELLLSQPQPPDVPRPQPLLPPKQERSRIIQIMLHPHPLLLLQPVLHPVLHPQLVAVKSLILIASELFLWFILCTQACQCFHMIKKFFARQKCLNKLKDIVK